MAKTAKQESFDSDAQVKDIVLRTPEVSNAIGELVINNEADQKRAVEIKGQVKEFLIVLDTRRRWYTDPLNKIIKVINAQARAYSDPLDEVSRVVDNKLRGYLLRLEDEQRKAQEKERERQAKSIEKGTVFKPKPVPVVEKNITTESGVSVTMRDEWKAEVQDEKEFIKYAVNEQLWDCLEINSGAVKRLAKLYKGNKQIPGLRIYNEKIAVTKLS